MAKIEMLNRKGEPPFARNNAVCTKTMVAKRVERSDKYTSSKDMTHKAAMLNGTDWGVTLPRVVVECPRSSRQNACSTAVRWS